MMPADERPLKSGAGVPANSAEPSDSAKDDTRRNFFSEVLSFCIAGVILLVPLVSGLALFFDPLLRKRRSSAGQDTRRDAEGFLHVASLASLPDNGRPQIFTVYDDLIDAWNKFADQPVGRVFLRKLPGNKVTAFNVAAPIWAAPLIIALATTIISAPAT